MHRADPALPDTLDNYLLPTAEAPALWCAFDPVWYLAAYPQAREELGEAASFEAVRAWYLTHGQPAGHSPVLWFDEAWYRATNPDVTEGLASGLWRSGFEHYCLEGSAGRSAHWLYDEGLYRALNPDLTDEALSAAGCFNRYDHYLRDGAFAGRPAHLLFDPAIYAAAHGEDPSLARLGAYAHALHALWSDAPETRHSLYFDPIWYRGFYPEAVQPPYRSALHHYLTNPTPTEFDPLPDFVEAHYLAASPDVAAEVKAGRLRNGYEHFLNNGAAERRSPAPWIDLHHYLAAHPEAAAALEDHSMPHAFAHVLRVGLAAGLSLAPAAGDPRAEALLALRSRGRLDFTCDGPASLTAIVTLPAERARAVLALAVLRAEMPGAVEVLLLDAGNDGSSLAAMMAGVRVLPHGDRNAAIAEATAPVLLFLDAGHEPLPGSIAAGWRRITTTPAAGVVGGPTLDAQGRLIQAGLVVFGDASTVPYLAGAPAEAPEANFVRHPDACASTLMLGRRDLLQVTGGFDPDIPPGKLADADLCLSVWQTGWRVVYDPAMAALCCDPRATRTTTPPGGEAALAARHAAYLALRPAPRPVLHAIRSPLQPPERVLIILPALPGADPTLVALAAAGAEVTLYPLDGGPADPALLPTGLPDSIELICGPGRDGLDAFLALRKANFTRIDNR